MTSPLFSVVIPAYNRAALIEGTLKSAFDQTETDYEVVVVDDGSTDGTAEVVERIAEAQGGGDLRLFRQPNGGPGQARNTGIERARGEYVVFLDSDDRWFPWTLATYRQALQEADWPTFLSSTGVGFEGAEPSPPSKPIVHCFPDYLASSEKAISIEGCAVAVRREALNRVGGFVTERINAEDCDLWLRLGQAPGYVHIEFPRTFRYRRHDGSAVTNLPRTTAGILNMIRAERAGRYPGGHRRVRRRRAIITRHSRAASLTLLRAGRFQDALRIYKDTLTWNVRLGRVKYVFGFPSLLLAKALRRA